MLQLFVAHHPWAALIARFRDCVNYAYGAAIGNGWPSMEDCVQVLDLLCSPYQGGVTKQDGCAPTLGWNQVGSMLQSLEKQEVDGCIRSKADVVRLLSS